MKIYVLAALLVLAGCARREGDPAIAVQDAVFRFQFGHNASVQQKQANVYFLAFGAPRERSGAVVPSSGLAPGRGSS